MTDSTQPVAAVVTRTKDRPLFLERAIRSVLGQTHAHWEHVIVNDGGDPAAVDLLVASFAEAYAGRVRVVHHERSRGMQHASNAGLAASESRYCVIHDDDDSWAPDFLEVAIAFLEREGADSVVQGVVTQTTQILEEITLTGDFRENLRRPYHPFAYVNMADLRRGNLFPPIAFLYRRRVHDVVGGFRQAFDVLGDHDFNLRFLRRFEIGVIPTFHAFYHWRNGSQGNTVTAGRETHRVMLARMKNAYHREFLDDPSNAVGPIDDITIPPPFVRDMGPFHKRVDGRRGPRPLPDFRADFRFSVLSLDVFDTVLKRRCHHPRDVFRFLEERALAEGFAAKPYALARARAEATIRERLGREVTLDEIHDELARLLGLPASERERLQGIEWALECEMLYPDPRWVALYKTYREAGMAVVFVSDMYLRGEEIARLLESNGFPGPRVFSSADLHLTKHDGQLLPEVARQLGVAPAEVLHVGDNFHSDCMRALQSGFQAHHWRSDYGYRPWYAEVAPDYFEPTDTLSARIMGLVREHGEQLPWTHDRLLGKLGYEAAGPLYLCFMLWVLAEAKKDGVRRLILLGRDGYYWEKTLRVLAESIAVELEFTYLHASRKVINFASFERLDEEALNFLLTPNPSLTVRDFIDRTGLRAEDYNDAIRMAGFTDPLQVLTREMGGQYTERGHAARLRRLFLLLEEDLKGLFLRDREGFQQQLREASFDPSESAFVDIGWQASSIKPMPQIVNPGQGHLKAYYFGTWKEAATGKRPIRLKSFFMHLGQPAEHEALIRESVNWIESLHAAPFPTLLSLRVVEGKVQPEFSPVHRGGFSPNQQKAIWEGAEQFLRDVASRGLPATGARGGFAYIYLVLKRLVCEPTPAELAAWGDLEHSDGFGIEVYKPLVQPVEEGASPETLMAAYRGSSWRRGFLASLPDERRAFVLQRLETTKPKTYEQLVSDLNHKIQQNDALWAENARLKFEASVREKFDRERGATLQRTRDDLDEARATHQRLQGDLDEARATHQRLQGDLDEARATHQRLQIQLDDACLRATEQTKEVNRLKAHFRRRLSTLKAFFLGKPPR
ncbi:MAG: glycosyltransferase [Opitutales bacterium]|nr:glycosyltransferase [Opitutales bacterium]